MLEDLSAAARCRRWLVDLAAPWLGQHALEIGSGLGDYCAEWASQGRTLTASEADPERLSLLRRRFAGDARVTVRELTVPVNETNDYSCAVATVTFATNILYNSWISDLEASRAAVPRAEAPGRGMPCPGG